MQSPSSSELRAESASPPEASHIPDASATGSTSGPSPTTPKNTYEIPGGSRAVAAASFVFGFLFLVASFAFALVWYEVTYADVRSTPISWSEALNRILGVDPVGMVGVFLLAGGGSYAFWVSVIAILFLPDVYQPGTWPRTIYFALRIAISATWPAIIAIWICALATVMSEYAFAAEWIPRGGPPAEVVALMPMIPFCCLCIAGLLARRATTISARLTTTKRGPLCEGCGYDLSHRPSGSVCTECGLAIEESLDPGRRRRPPPWERRPGWDTWIWTAADVLFRPRRFYERLTLQPHVARARGFALAHYLTIAIGGAAWTFALILQALSQLSEGERLILVFLPTIGALFFPLVGWTLTRAVCTVAMLLFARSTLPDRRWFVKTRAYETSFLWAYCGFNGLLWMVMVQRSPWFENLENSVLGSPARSWGVPIQFAVFVAGNAGLTLWWLLRYRNIFSRIRWSNF